MRILNILKTPLKTHPNFPHILQEKQNPKLCPRKKRCELSIQTMFPTTFTQNMHSKVILSGLLLKQQIFTIFQNPKLCTLYKYVKKKIKLEMGKANSRIIVIAAQRLNNMNHRICNTALKM